MAQAGEPAADEASAVAEQPGAAGSAGVSTLRVATYNLRDLLDDVDAAARVLRGLRADVVCVQEVPRHPVGDLRARRLARRAGLWAPTTHVGGGGTTVFVGPRLRVVAVRHVRLPVPLGARRRGFTLLDARVRPGGPGLRVASIHLGLRPDERERHAQAVAEAIGDAPRVVVAGDANESLDSPAVARLLDVPGVVPLGDGRATFPAVAPEHAIDVLLGRGWGSDREVEVEATAADLAAASDHRPRAVDLHL